MVRDRTRPFATAAQHQHSRELYESFAFGPVIVDHQAVVEDGQAECHKCGEWYRVTAPFIPHRCEHEDPICRMCGETALWVDEHERCQECRASL